MQLEGLEPPICPLCRRGVVAAGPQLQTGAADWIRTSLIHLRYLDSESRPIRQHGSLAEDRTRVRSLGNCRSIRLSYETTDGAAGRTLTCVDPFRRRAPNTLSHGCKIGAPPETRTLSISLKRAVCTLTLARQILVRRTGFEPVSACLRGRYNQPLYDRRMGPEEGIEPSSTTDLVATEFIRLRFSPENSGMVPHLRVELSQPGYESSVQTTCVRRGGEARIRTAKFGFGDRRFAQLAYFPDCQRPTKSPSPERRVGCYSDALRPSRHDPPNDPLGHSGYSVFGPDLHVNHFSIRFVEQARGIEPP